ncbi:MAG: tRNA epoxyqueuosine(34) reductase QueG [Candidatus Eremiobacteraeota bacterium]|nr:tRNA epoxyqueuosine(34) reductase QueG [Candidatus Eremiobacteraeota bacterium]
MTVPAETQLKARILEVARAGGAGAVRVCSAEDDALTRERFAAATERGDLATWPYDRAYAARAASPHALLPGARSVICIAVPFATAELKNAPPRAATRPLSAKISNYAWGADYHGVVRRVLEAISAELDGFARDEVSRVVCDTAVLAERAFAARAGLGWIGKHTNLIAPQLGSYVFLGEVVTSLALSPDPPLKKTCGSCRRCVVACPTGALRGDYTMDSTRCISDLTQRRDAIPLELRPLIGDWFWGCDLCQEVCPPTRRARATLPREFGARTPQETFVDLSLMLSGSSRSLRTRYRKSAMGWRGPVVLRRNAAVGLGNSLDRAAVPALREALRNDPSAVVRRHVAWALGRIGSPAALHALSQAAVLERSHDVQTEIGFALEPYTA